MTATIKTTGYLTLSEALESVAAVLNVQKYEAQKSLRELLYNGQVPSQIIENSGQPYDTPKYVWGGIQWGKALKSGEVKDVLLANSPLPQSVIDAVIAAPSSQISIKHKTDILERQ